MKGAVLALALRRGNHAYALRSKKSHLSSSFQTHVLRQWPSDPPNARLWKSPTVLLPRFSSSSLGGDGEESTNASTTNLEEEEEEEESLVPGSGHYYSSLGGDVSSTTTNSTSSHYSTTRSNTDTTNSTPWQAGDNQDVQRVTQKAIIYELYHQQMNTIEQIVPWFLDNMPSSYFHQVPQHFRLNHMKAIASVKDANMDLYLNLQAQTPDGRQVLTFIRPGTKPGTLLKMIQELPTSTNSKPLLSRLHVFSTKDESMSLNMFVYGTPPLTPSRSPQLLQQLGATQILDTARQILQEGDQTVVPELPSTILQPEFLQSYLSNCTDTYIRIGATNPIRFLRQVQLVQQVSGSEGTAVEITPAAEEEAEFTSAADGVMASQNNNNNYYWVDLAVANSMPQVALENLCQLLYKHELNVMRARLDSVPHIGGEHNDDDGQITILRTLVSPQQKNQTDFDLLAREIKRSKWLDPDTMNLVFYQYPWLGIARGEIITAFCALLHPILVADHATAASESNNTNNTAAHYYSLYSKSNIFQAVTKNERFVQLAASIADLFLRRFHPTNPLSSQDELEQELHILQQDIQTHVEDSMTAEILCRMLDIIRYTLKTNVYMTNRYALGLRLDPVLMHQKDADASSSLPFGILFCHGRRFNAYHVRFRDISRGGMRLVTPATAEQYAFESARHYEECYGLAFAQQLKNKDIPEGGSKAVILINTTSTTNSNPTNDNNSGGGSSMSSSSTKHFVMRKSVKAFTDTVLDLIVDTEETKEKIVDYFGKPEVLYLGPDEQVIPEDINWIIQRAEKRGYTTPAAFMSSKPRAGINHKEFGVTSEGVNVFLDVALSQVLGINPKTDSFTVKMTGGPDGDVAGNELKILIREYGDMVKIVGIADHSGSAEDPEGLNHDELIRLVHGGLSISHFDPTKLSCSTEAVVHLVDTPEGINARNSMHNRLKADAFLPCGGRPNTIDVNNYRQFIQADGSPSSPLIVEGANLFVTAEARQRLYDEAGVVIVKDSSANKGGVITSSYEICAAMLLTEDEFFMNKEQIVKEVLEKLRGLAKLEAELLFREFQTYQGSLPEISKIISDCINTATDALATALDTLSQEDRDALLLPLFRAHLPKTMADLAFENVHERVPEQYIKNAISSCLASKMVYKEGTKFIAAQPKEKLAAIALNYVQAEQEICQLMESLNDTNVPEQDKEKLVKLLENGGVRTLLGVY